VVSDAPRLRLENWIRTCLRRAVNILHPGENDTVRLPLEADSIPTSGVALLLCFECNFAPRRLAILFLTKLPLPIHQRPPRRPSTDCSTRVAPGASTATIRKGCLSRIPFGASFSAGAPSLQTI